MSEYKAYVARKQAELAAAPNKTNETLEALNAVVKNYQEGMMTPDEFVEKVGDFLNPVSLEALRETNWNYGFETPSWLL